MKKKHIAPLLMSLTLVLGACNKNEGDGLNEGSVDDGEVTNGYGTIDHGVDEGKVGFNMSGGTIEEAADVPADEKEAIVNQFELYMSSFNEKDVDTYLSTLSDNSKSFDKSSEQAELDKNFKQYDVSREATDVTIVKYSKEQAQVFSTMTTSMKQLNSGLEKNDSGRQVTVFAKEEGEWKVFSIHYLGDPK